jgi:hypothetical protein
MEWLPEVALRHSERESLRHDTAVRSLARAARTVFETDKYKRRGEFGELLLHILLRQEYGTIPAISKLFYKDSPNDTVKGFDAVHVVAKPDALELWLGEAKFYTDISAAIRDVVAELETHTKTPYLRTEFAAIVNKIDPAWPHADRLRLLLDKDTSLDKVFKCARIPVLLTYDSDCVCRNTAECEEYVAAFTAEVRAHHAKFAESLKGKLPAEVSVHLFLLPLGKKKHLVDAIQARLKAWQTAI